MKIAVSANQPTLESDIDPRFGRCQYFVIVDTDTMAFEGFQNTNIDAGSGAGINSAQMVVDKGAQAVLTGNIGPKASQVLEAAGVQMVTGVSGNIRTAVASFKSGGSAAATAPASGGTGRGTGTGRGQGMGRGMGGGGGRGMGMGMGGRGMGRGLGTCTSPASQPAPASPESQDDDISVLKNRAEMLTQELAEIQKKLKNIEKK